MRVSVISHLYPVAHRPSYGLFVHQQLEALRHRVDLGQIVVPVKTISIPLAWMRRGWRNDRVPRLREDDPLRDKAQFVRFHALPGPRQLKSALDLARRLRSLDIEINGIVHAHVILPDGYAALKAVKSSSNRLVVTVHGADLQEYVQDDRSREAIREVLESADGLVFVSRKLERLARSITGRLAESIVIHNGARFYDVVERADQSSRSNDPLAEGELRIFSAGAFRRSKGFDILLQAFARLEPPAHFSLRIAGEGREGPVIRRLVRSLDLGDRVEMLGPLSHEAIAVEMNRAHIFALPSWNESFGITYLEAMYQRCLVVACRNQGPEEYLEHMVNGLLVRERDVEDLRSHIQQAAERFGRLDPVRENAHRTAQEFTWERNVEELVTFYETLDQK